MSEREVIKVNFKNNTIVSRESSDALKSSVSDELKKKQQISDESLIDAQSVLAEAADGGYDLSKAIIIIPHQEPECGMAVMSMAGHDENIAGELQLVTEALRYLGAIIGGSEVDGL